MTHGIAEPATIGPFQVLRTIGEGAMGVVYAGHDSVLDRRVAIKLVRSQLLGDPAIRARMLREAQAMARLSSPHVVQVFQVGEHDESLYVAMEYIEGVTLTSWLEDRERPWRVVLRTLCDAGRGLAAAHAAGLVHRDFKPDNVLVDANGCARVLDFGLVRTEDEAPDLDEETETTIPADPSSQVTQWNSSEMLMRSRPRWAERLTQFGRAIGTPAYMSLEQHLGRTVGPASDQFSFAITLYEALYGSRPFQGATWDEVRAKVQSGVIPAPPPHSLVPRRLFKVIARGLAEDPGDRWPSMDEMIAQLEHDPWRVRSRVAVALGLVCATAAVSYNIASARADVVQRCQRSAHELAGVWDGERDTAVAHAFASTQAPFAADTLTRVRSRLDAYKGAWVREHQAACDAHTSGADTSSMMDLRVACLGRRKLHLAALVEQFVAADRSVVENAVQAVAALPSVEACADVDMLVGVPAPPNDPRTAARVQLLHEELTRAAVLEDTGRFEAGIELAEQVRGEAVTVGYAPLTAEAALIAGRLYLAAARWQEAEAALTEALRLGIDHDLHTITAEAMTRRIFVVGEGLGRRVEALAIEPFADALVQRARDDGRLSALLHNNLGAVYDAHGDTGTARVHYEQTIAGLQRRTGPPDPLIAITHNNLGNLNVDHGDPEAARRHFSAARELFTTILGDAHPFVAHAIAGLGEADARKGADADALASYLSALERMEAAYGPEHLYLLHPLTGLGEVHARLGQADRAELYFSRAVAIANKLGAAHRLHARSLEGLAKLAEAAGGRAQASTLYTRAAQVYRETLGAGSAEGTRAALRAQELAQRASL